MPTELQEQISVTLPKDLINYLDSVASANNTTSADVLQQAIANHQFLQGKQAEGAKILIEEKGKSLQEIGLPAA